MSPEQSDRPTMAVPPRTRGPALFTPDPARDVFLVSYPRSGNTWLRAAIAFLQTGEDVTSLGELDYIVPAERHPVPLDQVRPMANYVIKSHSPMSRRMRSRTYRRVVYLVRDPRDCLVSYFRYVQHRSHYGGTLWDFVMASLAGRTGPCSWQEHVLGWTFPSRKLANKELLVLRYEDLCAAPASLFRTIADFVGIAASADLIDEAVRRTAAPRMREREAAGLPPPRPRTRPISLAALALANGRASSTSSLSMPSGPTPARQWPCSAMAGRPPLEPGGVRQTHACPAAVAGYRAASGHQR